MSNSDNKHGAPQVLSVPSVPKLLKHSMSDHKSQLPDIKAIKMLRQTSFEPNKTYKLMTLRSSAKKNTAAALMNGPSRNTILLGSATASKTTTLKLHQVIRPQILRTKVSNELMAREKIEKAKHQQDGNSGLRMRTIKPMRTKSHKLLL